jgi:hypothetical protein
MTAQITTTTQRNIFWYVVSKSEFLEGPALFSKWEDCCKKLSACESEFRSFRELKDATEHLQLATLEQNWQAATSQRNVFWYVVSKSESLEGPAFFSKWQDCCKKLSACESEFRSFSFRKLNDATEHLQLATLEKNRPVATPLVSLESADNGSREQQEAAANAPGAKKNTTNDSVLAPDFTCDPSQEAAMPSESALRQQRKSLRTFSYSAGRARRASARGNSSISFYSASAGNESREQQEAALHAPDSTPASAFTCDPSQEAAVHSDSASRQHQRVSETSPARLVKQEDYQQAATPLDYIECADNGSREQQDAAAHTPTDTKTTIASAAPASTHAPSQESASALRQQRRVSETFSARLVKQEEHQQAGTPLDSIKSTGSGSRQELEAAVHAPAETSTTIDSAPAPASTRDPSQQAVVPSLSILRQQQRASARTLSDSNYDQGRKRLQLSMMKLARHSSRDLHSSRTC